MEELKENTNGIIGEYPEEIRERLAKNTLFIAERVENPYAKIIRQYDEDQKIRES